MKDTAEGALTRKVREGEAWAIQFYLKTQAKDRGYVERTETATVPAEQLDGALERELARLAGSREAAIAGASSAVGKPSGLNGTGHNGTGSGNGTLPH